jgi:hypothetical protein
VKKQDEEEEMSSLAGKKGILSVFSSASPPTGKKKGFGYAVCVEFTTRRNKGI